VTLRARWVTLRARWVTLRARWVTQRARWVMLRARLGDVQAKDPLAEALDSRLGHTVTDHAVFDQHARKYAPHWILGTPSKACRTQIWMLRPAVEIPDEL
jgi:hypothetical protein